MAYYANVTFPVRPEYDILSFPFAVAVFVYPKNVQDWSELVLHYSATPFSYDSATGSVTSGESVHRFRVYRAAEAAWSGEQTREDILALVPGLGDHCFRRLWTQQLLEDDQGRVYLAAGAVTPGDWVGLDSWMAGVIQGMNLLPFRAAQTGAPVFEPKYQYNNLVLPGLPAILTSQKYVVIGWVPSQQLYRAWAGPDIRKEYKTKCLESTLSLPKTFYLCDYGADGKWSEPYTQAVAKNANITHYDVEPVWSNIDLKETGSHVVVLEGSAPVSVVRLDPDVRYDPENWLLGWYLGQRLAKQRRETEVLQ